MIPTWGEEICELWFTIPSVCLTESSLGECWPNLRYTVAIQSKHDKSRGKTATSVCLLEYQLRPVFLNLALQTSPQISHAFCAVEWRLLQEVVLRSLFSPSQPRWHNRICYCHQLVWITLLAESESYFWSVRDDRACSASRLGADGGFGSLHEHLASDAMILQRL